MWAPRLPVSFGSYPSTRCPSITHRRCSSVVVFAARPPRFSSDDELGGLGHAVLNALQSPSSTADSSTSETLVSAADSTKRGQQSIKKKGGNSSKEDRELSGSEVLLALQKARARRTQKLKSVKKKAGSAIDRGGREAEPVDYSNVRQLNIKSNWGARLEELEKRLQDFINS